MGQCERAIKHCQLHQGGNIFLAAFVFCLFVCKITPKIYGRILMKHFGNVDNCIGRDFSMLVVTWTTVWNQQFFEGNFITARWGYFQHICIYLDCLVKNTGHSHNGVYGIPSFGFDPCKIRETTILNRKKK